MGVRCGGGRRRGCCWLGAALWWLNREWLLRCGVLWEPGAGARAAALALGLSPAPGPLPGAAGDAASLLLAVLG